MFSYNIFALVLIQGWSSFDLLFKTFSVSGYKILNGEEWVSEDEFLNECLFLKYSFEIVFFLIAYVCCNW